MNRTQVRVHELAPGAAGGALVVLAHGLEDSWTSWLPLAGELDPSWRLLALDLPWRSGNDYRWRDRRPAHWLADALAMAGGVPDALVAHSFGAGATLDLLCRPGACAARSAMLICPQYRLPDRPVSWRMFDRARGRFEQNIRDGVWVRVRDRVSALGPDVVERMMERALERVGPSGFLTVFDQFAASGELPLDRVRQPALVLAGGRDQTLSPAAAGVLAAAMPLGRLLVRDEYGHFCHVRHAGDVAAIVADFVTGVRAAALTVEGSP